METGKVWKFYENCYNRIDLEQGLHVCTEDRDICLLFKDNHQ